MFYDHFLYLLPEIDGLFDILSNFLEYLSSGVSLFTCLCIAEKFDR